MSTLYIGSQELVPILRILLMLIMWCYCWCVDVCVVYWEVTEVDVVIYCLYVNIWRPIPIVFVDVIVMLLLCCCWSWCVRTTLAGEGQYQLLRRLLNTIVCQRKNTKKQNRLTFLIKDATVQYVYYTQFANIFGPTKSQFFMSRISLLTNARDWQKARMPQKWLQ